MKQWLVLVLGYLAVVAVNALANILPINGQNTGDIANRIEVLFTPAGYVFSIWGLIYILLAMWLLRQFPKSRRTLPVYTKIGGLFLLTCVFNVGWILLWHYNWFLLSVPVMVGLLITLIVIYLRIRSVQPQAAWLDRLPFSVYLGWISVATIANISYVLVEYDWGAWGISPVNWTIILIAIATILGTIFRLREQDRAYALVFVWALFGIGVKQMGNHPEIVAFAWGCAAIVLVFTVIPVKYLFKDAKRLV
jgi:benzodiazapine receptor